MAKQIKYIVLLTMSIFLISCEDVVEVNLETAEPRLVIDAALKWEKGTAGNYQEIRISQSRGFYDESPSMVSGATVQVSDSENTIFEFIDTNANGVYTTNDFQPQLNEVYTLLVEVNGRTFEATEQLMPVATIDSIQQRNDGGFSGEDIELKAFYKDPVETENYNLFTFDVDFIAFPEFEIYDDEFNNGNTNFAFYTEEDLEAGNSVEIINHGISKSYYNYLVILLNQVGSSGGPFQTQPAVVRGNINDVDNPDDYIFGYFSLSEIDRVNFTVNE